MKDSSRNPARREGRIDGISVTGDTLTGRGGLTLFSRYLDGVGLGEHWERLFGTIRKNGKGLRVSEVFKQLLCFFVDGTSRHLVHLDRVREDAGYALSIETTPERMVSSHAVKRMLRRIWWPRMFLFRRLLQKMFIWRLSIEQPEVIMLGVDEVILNNDEAQKRQGVEPTYKRLKGFGALQMTWGRYVVDVVFRGGSKHCNHGHTVNKMIEHVVRRIRRDFQSDVPIVIRFDAGFFDQKVFRFLEKLEIGYIAAGKMYEPVKEYASKVAETCWQTYDNGHQTWRYFEFGDRRKGWDRLCRAFYLRPQYEGQQQLLEFARPESIIYTNLGMGQVIDSQLAAAGHDELLEASKIIETYHDRGQDELVFRALKEFGSETLPFKRFNQNAAWYYLMVTAFFLFESFKEDVAKPVIPVSAYATRVRRVVIDFAAKIVRHAGKTILKVTQATWDAIQLPELWARSGSPPQFTWA